MSDAPENKLRLKWSGLSHVGKIRQNNEDAFLTLSFDPQGIRYLGKEGSGDFGLGDFVFAVSDGMGGAKSGEFASRIAVEKITKLLPKGMRVAMSGLQAGQHELLQELFHEIHKALAYLGSQYEECAGMGTTLTLCWISPAWLYFAHIGDSRLYYLPQGGALQQLSEDDSYVGWLFRQQKINEREARTHPQKNSLQRALGAGHQFVDPQLGSVGLQAGDRFLLCSDGLVDGLWNDQLTRLLQEPDAVEAALSPAPRLVGAALENSGRDNITALVIEVEEEGTRCHTP
ncbi:MAG: serine/threonine-protein phosphatase [Blastochloris sp.]|nr:serine/threonine-protein phosphatase [Blastochloris sp.]